QILAGMGARVTVYDPAALGNARRACPNLNYARTLAEAVQGAHVVLLLTEWAEFTALTPDGIGTAVARRNIIDARNALDPRPWLEAGWNYRALGVAEVAHDVVPLDPSRRQPTDRLLRAVVRRLPRQTASEGQVGWAV